MRLKKGEGSRGPIKGAIGGRGSSKLLLKLNMMGMERMLSVG